MSKILTYKGVTPIIATSAYIASNAIIAGDVVIGENVGIWFGVVIRGDVSFVRIGDDTNIQDGTVIHVTRANHAQNKTGANGAPTLIGKGVTIGHQAIIHACTIGDYAFIGMGSIIMDMAVVESGAMIAAGAVVTPGRLIPSGQIWAGNPARYLRNMTKAEQDYIATSAENYKQLAAEYIESDQ